MAQQTRCKYCHHPLQPTDIVGQTVICPHCTSSYPVPVKGRGKALWLGLGLLGLTIAGSTLTYWLSASGAYERRFADLTDPEELARQTQQCLASQNRKCQKAIFKRRMEVDANDLVAKANYAFTLTALNEHSEAESIYKEILASGSGTYDVMALYAKTLSALDKREDAIKWYENALSLNPRLLDATEELAKLLFKSNRAYEAVSLVESFMTRFPDSRYYLAGNMVTMREQMGVQAKSQSKDVMRLLALSQSHHYLPIQLKENASPLPFLVDTGASQVTLKTEEFNKIFPELKGQGRPVLFTLADGRKIQGRSVQVPLHVGAWTVENVKVSHCANCENLAGQSLLKKFSLRMFPKGELTVMELRLN